MSPHTTHLLTWGHGATVLEVFLEPTCPFSARAFGKLDALLSRTGADKLTLKIRLQSQPWHTFSPVVCRAVLAAARGPGRREAAWKVLAAVAAHREAFILEQHATGANLDQSPRALLRLIEEFSGIPVLADFQQTGLDMDLKWHARYARQNGIHGSPTFMVNGLIAPELSSGDDVDVWIEKLQLT